MTKEQLEKTNIENLQLSQRCYNALYRKGYRVVGDLVGKTREEIKNIRNIGEKTFLEFDEKLLSTGFMIDDEGFYTIDMDKLTADNLRTLHSASIKDLVDNINDLTKLILSKEKELINLHSMLRNTVKELQERTNNEYELVKEENEALQHSNNIKYVKR